MNKRTQFHALSVPEITSTEPQIHKMSEVSEFGKAELQELKLVYSGMPDGKTLKAFRDLRTRLIGAAGNRNFTCMVTAIDAGGASYVAANLAAIIALDKTKSSVLVDCNLYRPSADKYLPAGSGIGLTDYLDDTSVACEEVVYGTGVNRMRAVPVGNNKETGTEKLMSQRMHGFMSELAARYDDRYIVVDTPPVSEYEAEVRILAEMVDFVVLVVPYGKVVPSRIVNELNKLDRFKLVGIVYNEF